MRTMTTLTTALLATAMAMAKGETNKVALADTASVVDLDEVVVVAQPKESARLRQQPIGSSVFTNKELKAVGADQMSALSMYVPSMAVPAYGARYTSSVYLRGIGSRIGAPSVGLYYDNVPIVSKAAYNRHFYQLDRIDVLRGPQGSLYGINTEAGLIRMYSKDPMAHQGTDIRLALGTGLYSNVEVAHYHRPSRQLAFSVAAFYNGLGGFFDNDNLGKKADLSNEAGTRLRLLWTPAERWKIDLTADYQYTNQNGFAYGLYDNETKRWNNPSTTTMNGYKRQMVTTGLNIAYSAKSLLFSSVTSHQYLYDLMMMDQDYMPQDYMQLQQRQKLNAITEELTLRSKGNAWWQHASGIFVSHQWLHTNAPVVFGGDMNTMIVANMGMPDVIAQGITISDNTVPSDFKTPQTNIGLYHESNISLANSLVLTLGLRYDHQHMSIDYNSNARFTLGFNLPTMHLEGSNQYMSDFIGTASQDCDQLLPKFALTYKFANGNIYANVCKGFRAGGYNLQMFADIFKTEQSQMGQQLMALMKADLVVEHSQEDMQKAENTISYKPETSWNYEMGTHLNLFNGKMHADLSAFIMHIHNQQLSVMAGNYGYGRMMVNAGRTTSCGVEAALRGNAMAQRLTWAVTYSYTNTTFRDYADDNVDYHGNKVPFVPQHTFSAMADYRVNLKGTLRAITIGANVAGNGPTYWSADNTTKQNLYAVAGAHLAFDLGHVELNLWGRNITDTRYNTFLVDSSVDGTSRYFAQRGNPIQAGIDVDIRL